MGDGRDVNENGWLRGGVIGSAEGTGVAETPPS